MKRSEMIAKVHWFLNDQLIEGEDEDVILESASDLVGFIEELGMLPIDSMVDQILLDNMYSPRWDDE